MTRYDKHYVQGQKPFEDLASSRSNSPACTMQPHQLGDYLQRHLKESNLILEQLWKEKISQPWKDNSKKSTPVDEFPKKVIRTSSSDWNHNCEPWNKGQPATLGQVAIRDCQGCEEKIQRCFCSSTFSCRSLQVCRKSCDTVRLRIKKRLGSNFLPRWLGSALLVHSPHGMASQQPWSPQSVWFFA